MLSYVLAIVITGGIATLVLATFPRASLVRVFSSPRRRAPGEHHSRR